MGKNKKIISLLLCLALVASQLVLMAPAFAEAEDVEIIDEPAVEEEVVIDPLAIADPTASVVCPPQGPAHNTQYAATPAGFRPDLVPASVTLATTATNANIFYNKAVVTVSALGTGPTNAQINAVADPNSADTLAAGAISLSEIDATTAVIIKAKAITTQGSNFDESSTVAFVYFQRLWVLSDVKDMPAGYAGGQEAWDDYIIGLVVGEMTETEKSTMMVGGQSGGTRLNTRSIGQTCPVARLCVPQTLMVDGPAGVRDGQYATPFPVEITISSSWDTAITALHADAVATEALYFAFDIMLGQGIDMHRSPLGGRNFEYYSEDPILSGYMAVAYSNALHARGIGESTKHYVANDQEQNRMSGNVIIDERTLREINMVPFEMVVKQSDPFTIMTSYNQMNGQQTGANPWQLQQVTRNEWGFKGYYETDWGGQWNANIIDAGTSMRQSGSAYTDITNWLAATGITDAERARRYAVIDERVAQILKTTIRTAVFNEKFDGLVTSQIADRHTNFYTDAESPQPAHAIVAQQIAEAGMVLLKNDNKVLPFANDAKIALVYDAVATANNTQCGNDFVVQGGGSGAISWDRSRFKDARTSLQEAGFSLPYSAVNSAAAPDAATAATSAAAAVASGADVGVLIVSRLSQENADVAQTGFNLTSYNQLAIPAFADAFHAAGKPFVVIINTGGAVNTNDQIDKYADAILYMGLGGWAGGAALANTLNGTNNPSGKMPDTYSTAYEYTVPIFAGKHLESGQSRPDAYNWSSNPVFYDEGNLAGYRWFDTMYDDVEVLDYVAYPFGYGLSYTTFEFSDLKLSKHQVSAAAGDSIDVSVKVTNTGAVAGREVVQIYIGADTYAAEGRPVKELKYFAKTGLLAPGASETVDFTINNARDLQYYDDAKGTWNTKNLARNNLNADPTYNQMRQTVGNINVYEALYAANPNLGYTKEGVNGAGWRVDRGTTFTVTASNGSATVGAYAAAFGTQALTDEFVYGEYASITAPEKWNKDEVPPAKLTYDIGLGNILTGTNLVQITAQFDKDALDYDTFEVAAGNGFTTIMPPTYDAATGIFKADLWILGTGQSFKTADLKTILSVTFDVKASAVKFEDIITGSLVEVKLQITNGAVIAANALFDAKDADTIVDTFLRWDTNGDGVLDMTDISFIIYYYYLAADGGPAWADAARFDANGDGIVDLADLLIIMSFI